MSWQATCHTNVEATEPDILALETPAVVDCIEKLQGVNNVSQVDTRQNDSSYDIEQI